MNNEISGVDTEKLNMYVRRSILSGVKPIEMFFEPVLDCDVGEPLAYRGYAKPKTGGNGEPETDKENRPMTNFESENLIVKKDVDNFASGDVAKITVVIWLEGDDPDCVDDILGGQ